MIAICHKCLGEKRKQCNGKCPCPQDGVDIIEHAKSGQCPIGRFNLSADELAKLYPPAPEPRGPGTELTKMYHQMGIDIGGCNCPLRASQMDAWQADGCREHLDEIVGWLTVAAKERGWFDVQEAGVKAFDLGLPMTIRGQVIEAIRREEASCQLTETPTLLRRP